jgi:hypothetical protein
VLSAVPPLSSVLSSVCFRLASGARARLLMRSPRRRQLESRPRIDRASRVRLFVFCQSLVLIGCAQFAFRRRERVVALESAHHEGDRARHGTLPWNCIVALGSSEVVVAVCFAFFRRTCTARASCTATFARATCSSMRASTRSLATSEWSGRLSFATVDNSVFLAYLVRFQICVFRRPCSRRT